MTCRTRIRYQKHNYSRPPGAHKKRISCSKPRPNALGQRLFKTEPLYSPTTGDETNPGFFQSLLTFFAQLWSPATTNPEKLGYAYIYGAPGTPTADTLLGEYGSGGANSAGSAIHVYLPTPNGPMPIAAFINGAKHAVHADHLNTPRKLTRANSSVAWQWAYSAFGDAPPTLAADRYVNPLTTTNAGTTSIPRIEFNLRYPGQVFDKESNLSYNYFRSYRASDGRYTQSDPIGLEGGWNRFGYVDANPLLFTDPEGLVRKPRDPLDLIPLEGGGGTGFGGPTTSGRSPLGPKPAVPQCPPGYDRVVKDPPFNPHGQKVFTNGKNYITPDVDQHKGGVWKMFDQRGNRTGTYDADLNRVGK
jgi:RHS repeat-associated protein